jgi:hypothetical protein
MLFLCKRIYTKKGEHVIDVMRTWYELNSLYDRYDEVVFFWSVMKVSVAALGTPEKMVRRHY